MPRKEWTPERKAEASRKAKERYAAKQVAAADRPDEPVFTVEEKPRPENYEPQGPVIIPTWRQYPTPQFGLRTVKMLRPICAECQSQENVSWYWFTECTHDPYVTIREVPRREAVYETLPNGSKRIIRYDEFLDYVAQPNKAQAAFTPKVNGGKGVVMAEGRGWVVPSSLRSPHFPFGIAEACEYRECWKQTDLKVYSEEEWGVVGRFCRREEAALVWKAENPGSGALEVGYDENSRRLRRTQLASVPV